MRMWAAAAIISISGIFRAYGTLFTCAWDARGGEFWRKRRVGDLACMNGMKTAETGVEEARQSKVDGNGEEGRSHEEQPVTGQNTEHEERVEQPRRMHRF